MLSVFNRGALKPALAAILSPSPPRELDLYSENEPISVNSSPEPFPCDKFFPLVFPRAPRKNSSALLVLGDSKNDLEPMPSTNIEEKKSLGLGLGGTQSPIMATLSSMPVMNLKPVCCYQLNIMTAYNQLLHQDRSSNPLIDMRSDVLEQGEPQTGADGDLVWASAQKATGGAPDWKHENLEVTSSASVGPDYGQQSTSMQAQNGAHPESGDVVDASSTFSNDEDEDDRSLYPF